MKVFCPVCRKWWTYNSDLDFRKFKPTKSNRFTCRECEDNMKFNIDGNNEHGLRKYDKLDRDD